LIGGAKKTSKERENKMANAREEFLEETKDKSILCAAIRLGDDYSEDKKNFVLRTGYTSSELISFLSLLDFEYDDGFGGQNLFGIIWYSDGTWSDRYEYDGSERWQYEKVPEIPKECAAYTIEVA
jgi:hypothetical protein